MSDRKQVKVTVPPQQLALLDSDRGVIPRGTFLLDFWIRNREPKPRRHVSVWEDPSLLSACPDFESQVELVVEGERQGLNAILRKYDTHLVVTVSGDYTWEVVCVGHGSFEVSLPHLDGETSLKKMDVARRALMGAMQRHVANVSTAHAARES
jgi:hypothetical protein